MGFRFKALRCKEFRCFRHHCTFGVGVVGMADLLGFTNDAPAMDGSPQDNADPFQGMPVQDPSAMSAPVVAPNGGRSIPEMTVLREWEEKHAQHLEELDRKEI